jgi:hypothetical protein
LLQTRTSRRREMHSMLEWMVASLSLILQVWINFDTDLP